MIFLLALFMSSTYAAFGDGDGRVCSDMFQVTTGITFPAIYSGEQAECSGTNQYDCLSSRPNPTWFYFKIGSDGRIRATMSAARDIDFIVYGPYASETAAADSCCNLQFDSNMRSGRCSFSGSANEVMTLDSVTADEIYILLITNYAGTAQDISLTLDLGYSTGSMSSEGVTQRTTPQPWPQPYDGPYSTATQINNVLGDDFCIELEFNAGSNGQPGCVVDDVNEHWYDGCGILDGDVPHVNNDFGVTLGTGGEVFFGVGNPDTSIKSNGGYDDGSYHSVCATRQKSNGEIKLWVDNVMKGANWGSMETLDAASELIIGSTRLHDGYVLNGVVRNIRLYNDITNCCQPAGNFNDGTDDSLLTNEDLGIDDTVTYDRNCELRTPQTTTPSNHLHGDFHLQFQFDYDTTYPCTKNIWRWDAGCPIVTTTDYGCSMRSGNVLMCGVGDTTVSISLTQTNNHVNFVREAQTGRFYIQNNDRLSDAEIGPLGMLSSPTVFTIGAVGDGDGSCFVGFVHEMKAEGDFVDPSYHKSGFDDLSANCPYPYTASGTLSTDNYVSGNGWYELGESKQSSMSDCADACTATVGCASFSYGGKTAKIQYNDQHQSCRLYKLTYAISSYGDNTRFCANTGAAPTCTGCGQRERECWAACAGEGACGACNTASGGQGACCRKGMVLSDNSPCGGVDANWYIDDKWHQCVVLPSP